MEEGRKEDKGREREREEVDTEKGEGYTTGEILPKYSEGQRGQ